MIKTLRITTIIAAIFAVGLFVFPAVYGYRGAEREKIEQFLSSPGVIEKFNSSKGAKPVIKADQIPPLVKEARVFGLYLNPPVVSKPAPPPKPVAANVPRREVVTPDPPKSTAKFTLIGTSYYQSRPELSLAYIDEPGKGLYWVRQGAKVGHMLIEQVKDGSVIVKDNEKSVTLVPVRPPKTSLLKGQSAKSVPVTSGVSNSITGIIPAQKSPEKAPEIAIEGPSAVVTGDSVNLPSLEETAMMEKLIAEVGAAMEAEGAVDSNQSIEKSGALLDKFISELEAMRVPAEEARMLDSLGRELNKANSDPNRPPNSKIPRSRIPPRPPR